MGTAVAVGVWLVEFVLNLALLLAIGGAVDSNRRDHQGRLMPLHRTLNRLAFILSLLAFEVTAWVGLCRFLSSPPEHLPLRLWLPVVVGVGCGLASLLLLFAGRKFSRVGARAHVRRLRARARERIDAGDPEFACQIVVTDPAATAEDLRQCRAYIESHCGLEHRVHRRMVYGFFFEEQRTGQIEWKAWNPQEVGLSPFWDSTVKLTMIRHDQEWFLRTFFESLLVHWSARPYREVELLHGFLRHLNRASGWSLAAIEQLRPVLLPKVLRLLEPGADAALEEFNLEAVEGSRELLTALLEQGPQAPPPVPVLASAAPPDAIGIVRMSGSGDLEFWMRATATAGDIGDVYFRHGPGTRDHARWLSVLRPLERGQVRPVLPL